MAVYGKTYAELIALGTASFFAFGLFSLPAGWLADRWSRRNMMVVFYIGCGVSLIGAALAPNLIVLAVALFALGMFAAIYHPVGTAIVVSEAVEPRPHARVQRRVRQSRRRVCRRHHRAADRMGRLARGVSDPGGRSASRPASPIVMLVPDDRHKAAGRSSSPEVRLAMWLMVSVFGLFVLIGVTAGLVFNTVTIALPKVIDERISRHLAGGRRRHGDRGIPRRRRRAIHGRARAGEISAAYRLCGGWLPAVRRRGLGGLCDRLHAAARRSPSRWRSSTPR